MKKKSQAPVGAVAQSVTLSEPTANVGVVSEVFSKKKTKAAKVEEVLDKSVEEPAAEEKAPEVVEFTTEEAVVVI